LFILSTSIGVCVESTLLLVARGRVLLPDGGLLWRPAATYSLVELDDGHQVEPAGAARRRLWKRAHIAKPGTVQQVKAMPAI
jgi:hypothetical protein